MKTGRIKEEKKSIGSSWIWPELYYCECYSNCVCYKSARFFFHLLCNNGVWCKLRERAQGPKHTERAAVHQTPSSRPIPMFHAPCAVSFCSSVQPSPPRPTFHQLYPNSNFQLPSLDNRFRSIPISHNFYMLELAD
jgi:hypothetical protein